MQTITDLHAQIQTISESSFQEKTLSKKAMASLTEQLQLIADSKIVDHVNITGRALDMFQTL